MLQWMGGSRRKVYASRKSTNSRQKRYFEQKKRQPGLENQIDITGRRVYHHEEPRSLDILSLNNLATPNVYCNDNATPQVDCTVSNASPAEVLKKITSVYNSKLKEASSQARSFQAFGCQDAATAANSCEQLLDCKISPPKNVGVKQKDQNERVQREISLIDLVSDDGSKNKSSGRSVPEGHVAFSVKGLGKVMMETPPHSPRPSKRFFPSPPKATRYMRTEARRSIRFDAANELDSIMNDVNMFKDGRPSDRMEKSDGILDESGYVTSTRLDCYFPDSFGNLNDNSYAEDEDMFYEPEAEKRWQARCGNLDSNPLDENSDRLWKIDPFNSDDHFPTPNLQQFDKIDCGFENGYSPKRRTSTRTSPRFESSGIPSSHPLFFSHSSMEDDEDPVLFEWERPPPIKKISNSNSIFGPPAWSFNRVGDSQDRKSPLSEESCSSTAVREERSYNKPSQSAKSKENKINEKDDFQMSLDKFDIPKLDGYLDGSSQFSDVAEVNYKRTTNKNNFGTGYCPEKAPGQQRIPESNHGSSLKDNLANWTSAHTSHLKGGIRPDNTSLDCALMSEDTPFIAFPDVNLYPTVGSIERTSTLKIPATRGPDNIGCENSMSRERLFPNIHLPKPVSDTFGEETQFPYSFSARAFQKDIDVSTFSRQNKADKNKEEKFETFENPKAGIFVAKKSTTSVSYRTVVGQHSTGSDKDAFRQGFSPGIHLQKPTTDSFRAEGHVPYTFSRGTFQKDLEPNTYSAQQNAEKKKEEKIGTLEKPCTKILVAKKSVSSESCRTVMSETETGSDGSEVSINPEAPTESSAATLQVPAEALSCIKETSTEMVQVPAQVKSFTKDKLENYGVDFQAPFHLSNKFHTESNSMIQSPSCIGEKLGMEKKVVASMGPSSCDVQYQVMLERYVLRLLCVQKVLVEASGKDKQEKDERTRAMEEASDVLARSY